MGVAMKPTRITLECENPRMHFLQIGGSSVARAKMHEGDLDFMGRQNMDNDHKYETTKCNWRVGSLPCCCSRQEPGSPVSADSRASRRSRPMIRPCSVPDATLPSISLTAESLAIAFLPPHSFVAGDAEYIVNVDLLLAKLIPENKKIALVRRQILPHQARKK